MRFYITAKDAKASMACEYGVAEFARGRRSVSLSVALAGALRFAARNEYYWQYIIAAFLYRYKLVEAAIEYLRPLQNDKGERFIRYAERYINDGDYGSAAFEVTEVIFYGPWKYINLENANTFNQWLTDTLKAKYKDATVALSEGATK